jgi:hypothetical protein
MAWPSTLLTLQMPESYFLLKTENLFYQRELPVHFQLPCCLVSLWIQILWVGMMELK